MNRAPGRRPTHPGEIFSEDVVPATGKSKSEIARRLGIVRQHLRDVLAGRKPFGPRVAVRPATLFGNSPPIRIRMQGAFDAWNATLDVDVAETPR